MVVTPSPLPTGRWLADRLAATDPGYARLITAGRTVAGLVAVITAEGIFVHLTRAMEVRVGPHVAPAAAALQHHQLLLIALLISGTLSLVTGFAINDLDLRQQLISLAVAPVTVLVALAVGLALGGHRTLALASFPVLLFLGGYGRRFGSRGFTAGMLLFIGDFTGFLLHGAIGLGDLGWLAAELAIALLVLVAVRVVFTTGRSTTVRRLQRSYEARAARVAELAVELLDGATAARTARLDGALGRLNEAALLIDAQLGSTAGLLHQRLFDIELALTNMCRFAAAMAAGSPVAHLDVVRSALLAVRAGDLLAAQRAAAELTRRLTTPDDLLSVIPHRFASSINVYAEAMDDWRSMARAPATEGSTAAGGDEPFSSVVTTSGSWLPGSAEVSAEAATVAPPGRRGRLALPIHLRAAVQMSVAVGAAIVVGDAISPRRFYWAVLAAFLAFAGTNHTDEQIRKALQRVAGTLVGIVFGSACVRLIGHDAAGSLVVVVVSIFVGVYLFRISYAFMVVGITVAISQVYVQLDEYSTSLLLVRLAETVAGSAVALVVVAIVLPLRSSQVFEVALARELRTLAHLAADAVVRLTEPASAPHLRAEARELDAAHRALVSTAAPMHWSALGDLDRRVGTSLSVATAARNYGRNLILDVEAAAPFAPSPAADLVAAGRRLATSVDALVAASEGDRSGVYVRASSALDRVDRRLEAAGVADPRRLVLRDLTLMDGALATLAERWGLAVEALDTGDPAFEARP